MTTPATTAAAPTPLTPAAASVLGRFLWHDLMTSDVAAATRFYAAVAGWTATVFGAEEGKAPYLMWLAGERPVGGVTTRQDDPEAPPAFWMAHVGTPDLDGTYAAALALGARSHVPPTVIPTVGRFAIVADPQGAPFSLYEPADAGASAARRPDVPGVGEFSWYELATGDALAAFDFYERLFGWERTETMDMGPIGPYVMYGQGGTTYGGMFNAGPGAAPAWLLYVRVDDVERAVAAVRAGGGEVLRGPMEVPGGDVIAQCRDPQGAFFAVHATRAAA